MNVNKYSHVNFKPGDEVWGFAYTGKNRIRGKILRQRPVHGRLLSTKYFGGYNDPQTTAKYFVPYGKFDTPMWSKVIAASSRRYAATEKEAIIGYNAEIQALINENQTAIETAKADFIPM